MRPLETRLSPTDTIRASNHTNATPILLTVTTRPFFVGLGLPSYLTIRNNNTATHLKLGGSAFFKHLARQTPTILSAQRLKHITDRRELCKVHGCARRGSCLDTPSSSFWSLQRSCYACCCGHQWLIHERDGTVQTRAAQVLAGGLHATCDAHERELNDG